MGNRYNDTAIISAVLLPDGWHTAKEGTFYTQAFEFRRGDDVIMTGDRWGGAQSIGYGFETDDGETLFGPVSAIQAVRTSPPKSKRT